MEADHAVDLPFAVYVVPDADEPVRLRLRIVFLMIDESVETDLDGAETRDRIYFYTSFYEDAGHLAADIVL